jgi:XTP/dITP diphosphohydrolase
MIEILLATRNHGKVKEINAILKGLPIIIKSLSDYPNLPDVIEDGKTLEENALKKAREVYEATLLPTIADDTGLEVDYLNKMPGVFSARYAGEDVSYEENNKKLLKALENVPMIKRGAQFRCVAVYKDKDFEKIVEGVCRGKIIEELRGTGGFGYDPLFMPDGFDKTFAELSSYEKNKISHRAMAFIGIKNFLMEHIIKTE